mgnify:FL=1
MGETGPVTDSGKGVQSPLARYQSPKDNMLLPEASIGVSATKHIFMTINSPQTIAKMLKNKGAFPGDPAAESIYSFFSVEGKRLFAVFLPGSPQDIYTSPYVVDPVALFELGKVTKAGKTFLKELAGPEPER